MRITIRKTVERDFMGGKSTTTKIVIDGAGEGELLRLLSDAPLCASPRLERPGKPSDPGAVDVTTAMEAAARQVFLSPERVEALRSTLCDVYRAMERARRSRR